MSQYPPNNQWQQGPPQWQYPPNMYYPPQQPPPPREQMIRTYHTGLFGYAEGKFRRHASKLAKKGWRVQSQTSAGTDIVFRRARHITVVYVR